MIHETLGEVLQGFTRLWERISARIREIGRGFEDLRHWERIHKTLGEDARIVRIHETLEED